MNLDELRSVQNKERQKDSLQHLRESFYEDVAAYVVGLEDERERVAADAADPFSSPEVRRLTDEIETAKDVTRAIYERRLGKLVKRASLAAADMPVDDEGLTAEERDLFADLVDRIERNKSHVLDVVEGDAAGSSADPAASAGSRPDAADSTPSPADDPGEVEPGSADRAGGSSSVAADEDGPATDSAGVAAEEAAHVVGQDDGSDAADVDESATALDEGDSTDDAGGPSGDDAGDAAQLGDADDRATVRITQDVGEIFGVDEREYDLSPETVVTLPEANAEPLVQRGAAERID